MLYTKADYPTTNLEEDIDNYYEENYKILKQSDYYAALSKKKTFRVFREDTKDGIHFYQIVKYGSKKTKIVFCGGICPDEKPIDYWGKEILISSEYVDIALLEHPAFPEHNNI